MIAQVELPVIPTTLVVAWDDLHTIQEWCDLVERPVMAVVQRVNQGFPFEAALYMPKGAHPDVEAAPGHPGSWTWYVLDYEDDEWAQDFVSRHPGGATLEEVADVMGITRERLRQMEEQALAKLAACGVSLEEFLRQ